MISPNISCRATDAGQPLPHLWSVCVGAGRAQEGLRANWQQQLRRAVHDCGFRYLRFHGLFHDDMFVYREDAQGHPVYNWQYIDALFDAMLEIGIRPFVELGFMPHDLATSYGSCFWWKGHGCPPKDYGKWAALVTMFVRHCRERYGVEEVRQWYFEVWNEPNLHKGFFTGTRSQYFELYRVTVDAIKAIDPALRVGGPATSNYTAYHKFDGEVEVDGIVYSADIDIDTLDWQPVWVEAFLHWCGEQGLPVDFVSVHPYPTDYPIDADGSVRGLSRKADSLVDDLQTLRRLIAASVYPQAEIHCTEWSSSPSDRDLTHDFPQAAAYIIRANLRSTALAQSLSYWVFTDVFEENGAGDTVWHGGFGMLNFQGIAKPAYHAYRFLHRLGTEVIDQGDGYIVTRHADGRITTLLYHYPAAVHQAPPTTKTPAEAYAVLQHGMPSAVELTLTDLAPGSSFAVETLDADHGWARRAWEDMGAPEPPNRREIERLHQASQPALQLHHADAHGAWHATLELQPWAVVLIEQI